ncbi:hypothetical protein K431DRAFT_230181 [Polychaeton citri CBS 116435]|uniref:Zn(2)-C6 fungal-type domain-containing protein n=1 Tax=Polychaeton citri CBS 116435 TaxID=1314669 RepID=A0A9P4UMW5_9PEZI|nr:hypothetical protein K431DRAFT_230181 [Polychaeton citri CBS 116435]
MQHQGGQGNIPATPLPTRVSRACDRCRRNKSRCDPYRPCSLCTRSGAQCATNSAQHAGPTSNSKVQRSSNPRHRTIEAGDTSSPAPSKRRRKSPTPMGSSSTSLQDDDHVSGDPNDDQGDSTLNIARNLYRLESKHMDEITLDAIPGSHPGRSAFLVDQNIKARRTPTSFYLTNALPPERIMLTLLADYFDSVHWFSLVIVEPKFRRAFDSVRDGLAKPSEKSFLLLLSAILGLSARYRSYKRGENTASWQSWSEKMISNVEDQLPRLLERNSLVEIQTLTLLGSFYVYHGRPNLSFSLLGATVKAAQAAGLHRNPHNLPELEAEERKRVWWTIYTWDRFASITYGRPLGVNDKDCNVEMPQDIFENIVFREQTPEGPENVELQICYSAYQRELNKLYIIASPAIESLYSARESTDDRAAEEYMALLQEKTTHLWQWRKALPSDLRSDLTDDCPARMEPLEKARRLQALSLHLTFDSLQIILHRPFLRRELHLMQTDTLPFTPVSRSENASAIVEHGRRQITDIEQAIPLETSSPHQWWEAAVRTSRVTEQPRLAQAATDSHLVSFLALNLFNAAIVMVVLALLDPLGDRAQQAKRAVARIYRLQAMLGSRSALSKQSSEVLSTLVQLLLRRESETILAPVTQKSSGINSATGTPPRHGEVGSFTVHEALAVPLGADFDAPTAHNLMPPGGEYTTLASRLGTSLATVQRGMIVCP